ncbi:hypothetical protein [Streptomyces sp. GC420]|uniref:hypothetical protein n=1 Tax=Streptomyces sp. GC420 TaxID=2697568 RepID=UPI00141513E8|nr:hypothetical protein [Streptomyces sp. GC420]NBM15863.1 hypothetical protein [Streptomyces sp. GC420]
MSFAVLLTVCGLVIVGMTVLSLRNEPPFWAVLLICLAAYPLAAPLLRLPLLSGAGHTSVVEWGVRLALISTGTAALSLVRGRRRKQEPVPGHA